MTFYHISLAEGEVSKMNRIFAVFSLIFILSGCAAPPDTATIKLDSGRYEKELSGPGWHIYLDHGAEWYNDDIFLPPVDLASLPVNPPSCGWDALAANADTVASVPGTVEEYFWGPIGGAEILDAGGFNGAGDYRGVSWWSRSFTVDPSLKGRRITLQFAAVNLRAEIFVNQKLVGYDVIGNTPFSVDITSAVTFTGENTLDVRITDPVGNFNWNDNVLMRWGNNLVPAVHGFGGITGSVTLRATDEIHVDDIYVQNQPTIHDVKVFVELGNTGGTSSDGTVSLVVHESGNPDAVLWSGEQPCTVSTDGGSVEFDVSAPDAKIWDFAGHRVHQHANLYEAAVTYRSGNGKIVDNDTRTFGFRWFDIREKDGDPRFYLNDRRFFIFAAMTRGFWPKNGIFATPEMAEKDIRQAVDMGFNMMLYHRAIGQPRSIDVCDRMGVLSYQEPGGYQLLYNKADDIDGPDEQAIRWRTEKVRRNILRDRSRPSFIIYNLKNEARFAPTAKELEDMRLIQELDPTLVITYNSDRNRDPGVGATDIISNDPYKVHLRPFDPEFRYDWFDQHHWFSDAGYVDTNYNNPRFYLRYNIVRDDSMHVIPGHEVVFWGEEGAFGTMVRLEKIRDYIADYGSTGFREEEHLDWYSYYNEFLTESGFRSAYPTVDDLTLAMGHNMHYFHGRSLENVRMSNVADGYNLNGWASAGTRTDLADMYRFPTGDPSIIQYYSQPLYIAVKLREKVYPAGGKPVADIFLINENDLSGAHTLDLTFTGPGGDKLFTEAYDVDILGGEEFGQLLVEGVELPTIESAGYYMLKARIVDGSGTEKATGHDEAFVTDYADGSLRGTVAVMESDGVVGNFLRESRSVEVVPYKANGPAPDYIIIGSHEFPDDAALCRSVYERADGGAKVVILEHADKWAEALDAYRHRLPKHYQGGGIISRGNQGRQFVGNSPYLAGLPQAVAMSWEYQFFYHGSKVSGLRLDRWGTDYIVALGHSHSKEILCALGRVPMGNGAVFLSTLDMVKGLGSSRPQAAVAKKLFLNLLER